ncbi:sigma-70 family RNA polymerase sigma factor [Pseudomonas putida]|uniref:Sigma-70 family RNA polymerase sigma factor n=1 Tax=Pseudomonas putida TaxID=303 RepID=A0A7W2L495_PSEPU|nr:MULTISPECIES: sigma-70 family RNA polymerase sigma factor [Pseudomonas]MBA6118012.1 sigma-70 family RNA polymerase sigma factor [Pseudomonas putida]MBI6941591.1 sigma-70 family RNA polymerase sigma factor [Pseudomonas putida]MBI6957850.1 sigma-70 family RNA polymerase sigma factor [Pseudomonas putida]MCZ9635766.1 sigma-70 family RNA polymerase sigma factor [Pseudomonas putida]MEC4879131.1 sigma-70 family RNA polymerase sigma factor [Pseudomonas sp. NC26]
MSGRENPHGEYVGSLFRSHYPWLCARLRRHLGPGAEDVAADTFVQLLSAPDVVPIQQPRALLTTIAQRLMYQLWRRRDLERAYLDTLLDDEECLAPSPESLAQMIEALQAIDALLDGLPAKVKATFLLSQLNGLTYPQIAQELGISQRSVSDYMAKAFNRCLKLSLD